MDSFKEMDFIVARDYTSLDSHIKKAAKQNEEFKYNKRKKIVKNKVIKYQMLITGTTWR